jgi:hypothetical protein
MVGICSGLALVGAAVLMYYTGGLYSELGSAILIDVGIKGLIAVS